ncbi:radial spoke head protein 9 homolog [Uranotaenia lowii]|uniref:radial spoke head protein 9 homolog n=1 Tax=Uranotaenia lowii TaxID=190385 RepID=UPI00247A6042|nr:radial spoke head protein 9 homolog [Uranotaenia lowii]
MNLEHLYDHFRYMWHGFRTLSAEEQVKLEHSLRLLQRAQKLQSVYFMGKLEGIEADYLLAFGCPGRDVFKDRLFFYSQDSSDWFMLQEPKEWDGDLWSKIRAPFQGDPALKIEVNLGPGFELDEDLVPIQTDSKPFTLKEQNRLWFTMSKVLEEAALLPRGVLYQDTDGSHVINPFFNGLSLNESMKLCNYQHFRKPIYSTQDNLLRREDYSYFTDVYDTAEDILPKEKSYVVRHDLERNILTLRSLHWPGLVCFHRANSNIYGFYYYGDGIKNWDLMFRC